MDRRDEIAKVAHDLFEKDGRLHGKDFDHWIEAEAIVKAKYEKGNESKPGKEVTASKPEKKASAKTLTRKEVAAKKAGTKAKTTKVA
jgi:hypothetical protein